MSSIPDPFGFETPAPSFSPRPITIIARPGQEIRILVADDAGNLPEALMDRPPASPSRSPDASPSRRPDASPSRRPDRFG